MTTKLLVSTPSELEIVVTREFKAPRELVFKAYTDPALVPKWFGPRSHSTTVDKLDLRPGGEWRYISRDEAGAEFAFRGEYREVVPPERLVSTFEFEGMPGHISVDTLTLEEVNGTTTLTSHSQFQSVEDRDGMLNAGMEAGMAESLDQLEELLSTL